MTGPRPLPVRRPPAALLALVLLVALMATGCGLLGEDVDVPATPSADAPLAADATAVPATTAPQSPAPAPGAPAATAPESAAPEPTAPEPAVPPSSPPEVVGTFDVDLAPEVSGLATSWTLGAEDAPPVWLVDDGPGTDQVVLVDPDGSRRLTVPLGLEGRDTEAIAVGPCAAGSPAACVHVADIGDNLASRGTVQVHRFAEADAQDGVVPPVTTATFTLPDGPADAEAMVVTPDGRLVLLTKRDGVADVLVADTFADGVLRAVGQVVLPDPDRPLQSLVTGVVVTDAALARDGSALLLRTYDSLLRLTPATPGQGLDDLAGWAVAEVDVGAQTQPEAVTFWPHPRGGAGPTGWLTAGEGSGDLWLAGTGG